jgi:hypothetical protein
MESMRCAVNGILVEHSRLPICLWKDEAEHPLSAKIKQCRVLRDVIPPTPPGPEGSNGNGLVRAQ